jgi:predicted Rossmann fold flavoprotein
MTALTHDAIVIGAGAAGMMCAATAGQRGRRVALVDHYEKLGEKIRISGGGRCNFTNIHATHRDFISRNPDFCRSALARYTPRHFLALVESYGIAWHEKTLGQLFCDESSKQIIDMLAAECDKGNVDWRRPCDVGAVTREGESFRVVVAGKTLVAKSVVIASGGLTVAKIGATPFAYRIAEQFGLAIVPPKPALVPLALDPMLLSRFGDLSGVSLEVEAWCGAGRFREAMLFTHRGLSGPAILQVSSYWQALDAREPIHINLLPGSDVRAWLAQERRSKAHLSTLLAERMPKRIAQQWCAAHGIDQPIVQLSDRAIGEAVSGLTDWQVMPSGTLGYNKAEVTLGGVDTRGLSSKTMETLEVPGLFFIGEAVDVTGHLGGFNFQWAWASAVAAGRAV